MAPLQAGSDGTSPAGDFHPRRSGRNIPRHSEAHSAGAVLVSHWHIPGMPEESGTPVAWLSELGRLTVHVRCICPPEAAAKRFVTRKRHPDHLDALKPYESDAASMERLARLGPISLQPRVDVDTTADPDLEALIATLRGVLATLHQAARRDQRGRS